MDKKYSLAQLKRDAKEGKLYAKTIIANGSKDIPSKLKPIRQIVDSNSNSITFLCKDGKKSLLYLDYASLVDYTDDAITVYYPGERALNEKEQEIMDEWEEIAEKHEKQYEIDVLTDGNTMFYMHKNFFTNKGYAYLLGYDTIKGKRYNRNTKMVIDNSIRGPIDMQYEIIRKEAV